MSIPERANRSAAPSIIASIARSTSDGGTSNSFFASAALRSASFSSPSARCFSRFSRSERIQGVETVDQLRVRISADLEQRERHRAEGELKDALLKAALAKNEFEVPPSLVERAIDAMIEGAAERFARSGIDIRQLGLDYAKLRADVREQALTQVRGRLLLDAIADAEKLDATEEDIQAEIVKLAEDLKTSLPKLQQRMRGKEERETLRNQVRHDKAFALMAQAATVKAP